MKLSGLIKLVKSRSGILSALVAVLCGLLLGLIACHLYNLKKIEGFSSLGENNTTYTFDIKLDDDDHHELANLDHNVPKHLAAHAPKKTTKPKSDKDHIKHAAKAAIATFSDKLNSGSGSESPGTKVQMDSNSLNDFYNQLPRGISRNNIPEGDEDLYILKSEIVPPVCPACPTFDCPREKPCPPCPACERCPEPAFECKKVPNYNVSNVDEYLPSSSNYFNMSNIDNKQPRPLLNDFSQFN